MATPMEPATSRSPRRVQRHHILRLGAQGQLPSQLALLHHATELLEVSTVSTEQELRKKKWLTGDYMIND